MPKGKPHPRLSSSDDDEDDTTPLCDSERTCIVLHSNVYMYVCMAGKWVFNDFLLEQDGRNRTGDTSLYVCVIVRIVNEKMHACTGHPLETRTVRVRGDAASRRA